jgi:hypothetical protein
VPNGRMKTTASFLLLLIASLNLPAQGTVAFNNQASTSYRLWTNFGGPPQYMSGANAYRIGLYGSTDLSAAQGSLGLLGLATNAAPAALAGYFNGGSAFAVPGMDPGTTLRFQLRFWTFGAGLDWNQAMASAAGDPFNVILATSPFGTVTLGGGAVPPNSLFGTSAGQLAQGFGPVPEPSFGALAVLGALAGIFSLPRRKR